MHAGSGFDVEESEELETVIEEDNKTLILRQQDLGKLYTSFQGSLIYIGAGLFFDTRIDLIHFSKHVVTVLLGLGLLYAIKMFVLSNKDKVSKVLGDIFLKVVMALLTLIPIFLIYVLIMLLKNYYQPSFNEFPYFIVLLCLYTTLSETFFQETQYDELGEYRYSVDREQ